VSSHMYPVDCKETCLVMRLSYRLICWRRPANVTWITDRCAAYAAAGSGHDDVLPFVGWKRAKMFRRRNKRLAKLYTVLWSSIAPTERQ
jgi:hypothetical protein